MSRRRFHAPQPTKLIAGSKNSQIMVLIDQQPRTVVEVVHITGWLYDTVKKRFEYLQQKGFIFPQEIVSGPDGRGHTRHRTLFCSDPAARASALQKAYEQKLAAEAKDEEDEPPPEVPADFVARALKARHPIELAWSGSMRGYA